MSENYVKLYADIYGYEKVRTSSSLDVYKKQSTHMYHDHVENTVQIVTKTRNETLKDSDIVHLILNEFDYHPGDNNVK